MERNSFKDYRKFKIYLFNLFTVDLRIGNFKGLKAIWFVGFWSGDRMTIGT